MPAILGVKLRRVARFFGITDQEFQYWLGQVILPVFDVSGFVRDSKSSTAPGDLTPVAGTFVTYWTVPANKRWTLRAWLKTGSTGAAQLVLKRALDSSNNALGSSQSGVERESGCALPLLAGDKLGAYTNATAGDGAVYITIHYEEEDA